METIIVQDTDSDVLEVITQALEMDGFNVYPLLNYDDDFMDMIDKVRPHVVMLDFKLKGDVCMQLCHQIKTKYPHLPIIASSCNYNINEEFIRNGFDDYIHKPFDIDLLYQTLRKHIPNSKRLEIS